ncbi:MlaD family protein [Mycobacterium sp. AMU20-3851]|uniref:MCE family protein n=1 Tax=Mycobacterium sp. AMU20-3851 TaxID=3122055 RepID=UPI003754A5D6
MMRLGIKFTVFAAVMTLLTAALFFIFGQYRTGSTHTYTAVFENVSHLKPGESVRFSGVRVGTVSDVRMQADKTVLVSFSTDRDVVMTDGTRAEVRYLNLVGDRFLEIVDEPGSTRLLPPGARIPVHRTSPALDLDLLLGGLKPVVQGLDPEDINALTGSLIQVVQGQGPTMESLMSNSATFVHTMADRSATIQQLIDSLRRTLGTLTEQGADFTAAIDRLEQFISGLAAEREPVGAAIDALNAGTASLADLLGRARGPLAGTLDQVNRLAPALEGQKGLLDDALQKAPENYRKLIRIGSYGSFVNYYICSLAVRVTDLQGRTAVFPVFKQEQGRCVEP